MSFGATGVIGTSFKVARSNFFKVLGLYFLGGIVAVLVTGIFSAVGLSQATGGANGVASFSASLIIGQVLANIPMLAAGLATIGLLAHDATGRRISFGGAAKLGLRKTPISIVVSLLLSLIVTLAVLPVLGMVAAMGPESPAVVLMALAMIPFFMWLNAVLIPVFPALVVEDLGISAIKRGFLLSSGYRLGIIWAQILMGLVLFGMLLAFGLVSGMLTAGVMNGSSAIDGMMILTMFVYLLMFSFMMTVVVSFQAAVYARLVECE